MLIGVSNGLVSGLTKSFNLGLNSKESIRIEPKKESNHNQIFPSYPLTNYNFI